MSGIAMQGLSAAVVYTAIEKINEMIQNAAQLIDAKVPPAINVPLAAIPALPASAAANYPQAYGSAAAALNSALNGSGVIGSGPGYVPLPAVLEGAVASFFVGYLDQLNTVFPGLSAAGGDADAFVASVLSSSVGMSYSEPIDFVPGETAFLLARKQAFAQEREVLDVAAASGHRFAPGAAFDAIARAHAESVRPSTDAMAAAHAARLAQERSEKIRMVRASVDSRMDRVRRIQSQVAEAFKLKMRARGLWVNDQNAVIDAANNKIVMGAQFRARVDALLREAASALNSSVVAGLNAGDRDLQIGRLKMSNGQELVDLLGSMITTLFNQVRASGSYSGTERDVTDWETLLA